MSIRAVLERRVHGRILLPEGGMIPCRGISPKFEGVISVIGVGGMFIRTRESFTHGTSLSVSIEDTSLKITADCRVCDVQANGVGVEFTDLDAETQRKLQELLQPLRP